MNIEREIKSAIYTSGWNAVHRPVRDSVWSSVHNSISGNFLLLGQSIFDYSRLSSSLQTTLNDYIYTTVV